MGPAKNIGRIRILLKILIDQISEKHPVSRYKKIGLLRLFVCQQILSVVIILSTHIVNPSNAVNCSVKSFIGTKVDILYG
jgi:hypothetical protein